MIDRLLAELTRKPRRRSPNRPTSAKCWVCGQAGHLQRNCPNEYEVGGGKQVTARQRREKSELCEESKRREEPEQQEKREQGERSGPREEYERHDNRKRYEGHEQGEDCRGNEKRSAGRGLGRPTRT